MRKSPSTDIVGIVIFIMGHGEVDSNKAFYGQHLAN